MRKQEIEENIKKGVKSGIKNLIEKMVKDEGFLIVKVTEGSFHSETIFYFEKDKSFFSLIIQLKQTYVIPIRKYLSFSICQEENGKSDKLYFEGTDFKTVLYVLLVYLQNL